MELFVFVVFQLLMEVQSHKSPTVRVSPDVIRKSRSVKISCETPANVTVKRCHFYINNKKQNKNVNESCELDLTGAKVLKWGGGKSPASINITCYYTMNDKSSVNSSAATVTVLDELPKPQIHVIEGDVLAISCEILLSVGADVICRIYYDNDVLVQRDCKRESGESPCCVFNPTLSDLLRRSGNRQLSCDYSLQTNYEFRSTRSDTHIFGAPPQARLTASASVIKETDTVELSCENTEDQKMETCVFKINGRDHSSNLNSSCQLSLTGHQIRVWSEDQSSSVNITCSYTVMKGQAPVQSPNSDPVTVTIQNAPSTSRPQTSSTKETKTETPSSNVTKSSEAETPSISDQSTNSTKEATNFSSTTNLPTSSTKEPTNCSSTSKLPKSSTMENMTKKPSSNVTMPSGAETWHIVLGSTGAGVILFGLNCLCWLASKKGRCNKSDVRSQRIGMSSGSAEIYSLITSVPATSQLMAEGLDQAESHDQKSSSDETESNSFIMVENSLYQPSDTLADNQQKQGNNEENENVYHLYCTIPDKPVQSKAGDPVYSLLEMH